MCALGQFVFVALCLLARAERSEDNDLLTVEVSPSSHGVLHKGAASPWSRTHDGHLRLDSPVRDDHNHGQVQALEDKKFVCWWGLGIMIMVAVWIGSSRIIVSDEETLKCADADFESFAERLDKDSQETIEQSSYYTLAFEELSLEQRFARSNAKQLCRKLRLLCIVICLYALASLFVTVGKGHGADLQVNPSIFQWTTSSAAFTFNCSAICLLLLALSMYALTMQDIVAHSFNFESYVSLWLCMVLVLSTTFTSRWHVAQMFGESAPAIFLTFQSDEQMAQVYVIAILFITIHTPLRLKWATPVCAIAPIAYAIQFIALGSPESEHFSDSETRTMVTENTLALVSICFMCLAGVHFVERGDRANFLRTVRSFEMVQELVAEEHQDDGSTAMGKARQALKIAASGISQLAAEPSLPSGLSNRMAVIKEQLDVAVKNLKNVDTLFEVDADNVLGDEFAEDEVLKDFINANLGGGGKRVAVRQQTVRLGDIEQVVEEDSPENSVVDEAEFNMSHSLGDYTHMKQEKASVMAKGWGEDWSFDSLSLARETNNTACLFAGECALIDSGCGKVLGSLRGTIRAWVREIHSRYLPNSYHNEAHASQVTHIAMWLAKQTGWANKASKVQMCSLMVASLAHDVGHTGRNNLFFANALHSFSLIWNDHAVLENMHAATCFSVMKGESHIMEGMEASEMRDMRNCIVRFILATDIKEHHASLMKLKARMEEDTFMVTPSSETDDNWKRFDEDMIVGGETIIKSADVGQGMLAWEQHKQWSYRVICEFFSQGDEEKSLGLSVSPLCERKGYNIVGGQAFFIDVLCKALFAMLVRFAEADSEGKKALEECLKLGAQNKEMWKDEAQNFYPETLSLEVIEQRFGRHDETTPIHYPYTFPKNQVLTEPISTNANLEVIAQFQNSVYNESRKATDVPIRSMSARTASM